MHYDDYYVRAKVVRGVGTDIADDAPVAPVNNWLHSLFSQVDVHLNDTLVTPSSNTYPFRAYVETLLSYGAEAKKTQLSSQLWYKDTAGQRNFFSYACSGQFRAAAVFN